MLTNPGPSSSSGANVPPQAPDPKRAARRRWSIFGLIVAVLLVYIVFVFWTRSQDNKLLERERAEKASADQRTADEKSVEALGGTDFKILGFYAQPGIVHKGESVSMCYGVANAKTVTLDPPVASVWPSATRCMQVKITKTTKFTLTAEDANGNKLQSDFTITAQ
jgi:hypothetical protein